VAFSTPWRSLEHAGWVIFEVVVLTWSCFVSRSEMHNICEQQFQNQGLLQGLENRVQERPRDLESEVTERKRAEQELKDLTADPKGRQLPQFLGRLTDHLVEENKVLLEETDALDKNVQHIKQIVVTQQSSARVFGVTESLQVEDLMEEALRFNVAAFDHHGIRIVRKYAPVSFALVDRHKVLQILINLLRNAKHALRDAGRNDKQITLTITETGEGRVRLAITDNGIGIDPENLARIFRHGFTTRKDGHGFGLHSGALAVQEMKGSLAAQSSGPGPGATFTLELPVSLNQLAA
jgi:signal transduction histidine kinase